MRKIKKKALVLGHDTRAFLSVIRSLGRGGIEVHVGWHSEDSPALWSRYVKRAHELPPYEETSQAWKDALVRLLKEERYELVIPCHDSDLLPLQKHRSELEQYARLSIPSDTAFEVLFDKFRTNALARSVGVPVPREILLQSRDDAARVADEFRLPVVLKPRSSFRLKDLETRHAVRKAYTWEDFDKYVRSMLGTGPVAVQENFLGEGVAVELLMDGGEPLMAFQHVRLHEPLHGGGSSYRKSVPVTPELLDASLRILRPLAYTGVAMIEFKVNPKTGAWVLIEVNARFWGSLPLALASGADFPLALFQLLVDGRRTFPQSYRTSVCCRNWASDVVWLGANLRADRSDPTLATRPLPGVLFETVSNLLLLRERSDTLTLDDPWPGLIELHQLAGRTLRSLGRKVSRWLLASAPSRWWLRRRARKALDGVSTCLFICKGNVCRSPFAEHLARTLLPPGVTVLSAGYLPRPGRMPPEAALATAAEWGIDLSQHRSRVLTESLLRAADVCFVFDPENYQTLLSEFRVPRQRLHYLGACSLSGPLLQPDPWGQSRATFKQCYTNIANAVSGLAAVLRGQPGASKSLPFPLTAEPAKG